MKALGGVLILASALCFASLASAESKPIACAFDQFGAAELDQLGEPFVRDLLSHDEAREKVYEKAVLKKIELCPAFKTIKDRQITLVADYTEGRITYVYVSKALGSPKADLIDTIWNAVPEEVRKNLFNQLGDISNSDLHAVETLDGSEAFRKIALPLIQAQHLTDDEIHLVLYGVTAQFGMAAAERLW